MWSANQADKETREMIPPEKQQEQRDPDFLLPRENPLGLRGYDQIVKLTYPDEASAGGCRISAAPLPCRKKLAFSCRWDDNNPAHLRMHGLMCRYGFRGTFYLNDLGLIPPEGISPEVFLGELLSGGCAAGAHGVRHASLAELTDSDEIFRELGVCRAMLEAACNAPVTAHAFAYGAYRRAGDPGAGRRIADCFTRCGFLHESYGNFPAPEQGLRSSDFSGEHWILPGDCDTSFSLFRQQLEERLADSRALEINPNLTVGLHSRQNGDGWREMEKCYSAYAFRPDWWYCTAGDYGAYRYEYHHAEIRRLSVSGREAVWRVRRLPPAELGGDVPLYLHCGNAVSAEVDGVPVSLFSGGVMELRHAADRKLPRWISTTSNRDNQSGFSGKTRMDGLYAGLSFEPRGNLLLLKVLNHTGEELRNPALSARLSPVCRTGMVRLSPENLPQGETVVRIELPGGKIPSGARPFFWCELDFSAGGIPGRIHALCNA